ncbi:hypothetical protein ACWEL8_09810 [Streptomyces sp. NPDC004690]
MTTDNNRGLVEATPIVPPRIIPDSESGKPLGADHLDLRLGGGLLLLIIMVLVALPASLCAVVMIALFPEFLPSGAELPVISSFVLSLIGALTVLSRRSYLRYVRVRRG